MQPLREGLVAALSGPGGHPHDPTARSGVEHVQTHISHVFLTHDRAYKLRKAVKLGFVSFATRAERNEDCLREIALNRRLAPDVYLGVAAVQEVDQQPVLGELQADPGRTLPPDVEHCVVMRRLPAGRDARTLLERSELSSAQIERVAVLLANFHRDHTLGEPAPFPRDTWLDGIRAPLEACYQGLVHTTVVPAEMVVAALECARRALASKPRAFEARRLAGRAVDGHGDLHLQHVFFERDDSEPLLIDCLEFSGALRRGDVASEVAFLAMDLRYHGAECLAEHFLAAYARESDDFDLFRVVDFFVSYRAAVRAHVAAIAAREMEIPEADRDAAARSALQHLSLAREALVERRGGSLVLVCGAVGTGKSTAARELADAVQGVVIASDRVRKRLTGLDPTDRVRGAEQDALYAESLTDRVYEGLLERAVPVLASGRTAILDATWSRCRYREAALRFAVQHGCSVLLVETRSTRTVALERLALRASAGTDASDAGPERFDASVEAFDSTQDWPKDARMEVFTDAEDWKAPLRAGFLAFWNSRR